MKCSNDKQELTITTSTVSSLCAWSSTIGVLIRLINGPSWTAHSIHIHALAKDSFSFSFSTNYLNINRVSEKMPTSYYYTIGNRTLKWIQKPHMKPFYYWVAWWCKGMVSDSRSNGSEFNSRQDPYQVTTLGKLFSPIWTIWLCYQAV